MQVNEHLQQLNADLRSFRDNLKKDSSARREDEIVTKRKVSELEKFKSYLGTLKNSFEFSAENKEITTENIILGKDLIERCETKIIESTDLLQARLGIVQDKLEFSELVSGHSGTEINQIAVKMGEQFNFKTASTLLPKLDNNNNTDSVYQLLEGVSFYESSLDDQSKPQLINYVLKICLSHRDRIRMNATYPTVEQLILDLKKNFILKQSAPALIAKLQASQQGNLSIDDYAKSIELLMSDLTISQEGENTNAQVSEVIRRENEKLAIDVFARGIRNRELRTIIKARNYEKLSQAIVAAKEETSSLNSESAINVMHGRKQHYSQKFDTRNSNNWSKGVHSKNNCTRNWVSGTSNFHNSRQFYNKNKTNFNSQTNRGRNTNFSRGNGRGFYQNNNSRFRQQGYSNKNFLPTNRMYIAKTEPGTSSISQPFFLDTQINQNETRTFFRDPTQN